MAKVKVSTGRGWGDLSINQNLNKSPITTTSPLPINLPLHQFWNPLEPNFQSSHYLCQISVLINAA